MARTGGSAARSRAAGGSRAGCGRDRCGRHARYAACPARRPDDRSARWRRLHGAPRELRAGGVRGRGPVRVRLAAARRAGADRALGRRVQPRQDCGAEHAGRGCRARGGALLLRRSRASASSSTSALRYAWDEEIVRGSFEQRNFTNWYLRCGRVVGALTFGRSGDLDLARRLLAERPQLDASARGALADPDTDLPAVGIDVG